MDKLKMETVDLTEQNIDKIEALFPSTMTESKDAYGNVKKSINFTTLKQLLSADVVDGDECYEFTWVGKKQSIIDGNKPIRKTLRPCKGESVNWDTTENLFIEGDNLDALKLLQNSYLGSIKMIYIDPPYNTGNDFVYKDNFTSSKEDYEEDMGLYDESDNRLFLNTERNGRYHSDWCSMIYPRLQLARNLLTSDGVIFISIDDNEIDNTIKICDEIFGKSNFIANCVRKRRDSQANLSKNISPIHEYVLIYSKQYGEVLNNVAATINDNDYKNPDNDIRGPYKTMPCTNKGGSIYTVITPTGKEITEEWRFKKETYDKLLSDNKLVFPRGGDGKPRYKIFLSEKLENGVLANTWLDNISSNQEATKEIKELFDGIVFDTPKPIGLLKFCLELATNKNAIVLDFFCGSATTAHAILKLNAEDGGKRKFIMVQLPEQCSEKSNAFEAGYKNICEIGKERIRRAGRKVKQEAGIFGKDLDIGFRVLKIDSSNMKDVYYSADEYEQHMLFDLESNIKEDRNDLDLLYGVLLDWGVPLSLQHSTETISNKVIHFVNGSDLIACFDENINESIIRQIARRKPIRVVFRDSSFSNSPDKINVSEIFKTLSPDTTIKVV